MSNLITQDAENKLALPELADRINREHSEAISHAQKAIEHALTCGRLLIEAKAQLPHGAFLPWLSEHCTVKERQARNYMRVANHWDMLPHDENLTIKGAIACLSSSSKTAPGADLGSAVDTRTMREQLNDLGIKDIMKSRAVGSLWNWAKTHSKHDPEKLQWMFGLSDDELTDLLQHLKPNGLEALEEMAERCALHFDLSFTPWPHVWILAITRETGGGKAQDAVAQSAKELQEQLDAAGLTHAAAAESKARADAWVADIFNKVGCDIHNPTVEGINALAEAFYDELEVVQ